MLKKIWVAVVFSVCLQGVSLASTSTSDGDTVLSLSQTENKQTDIFNEILQRAQQRDAKAQFALGGMYELGKGVSKDVEEAVKWYRAAAQQGLAEAQFVLGVKYQFGIGVSQSDEEAEKWYRAAVQQGLAEAQFALGAMYQEGIVVQKDVQEAERLWKLSCQQGFQSACARL